MGREATPEEQRVKFIILARHIREQPDYQTKFAENQDTQNRDIAFIRIFDEVVSRNRHSYLEIYRMLSSESAFKLAMMDTLKRRLRG